MSLALGERLQIRAMTYVAAEPVPFFWPMRAFIHHNPLHGLEDMPFDEAVEKGRELFHGRAFLPRRIYRRYLDEGRVDRDALAAGVQAFLARRAGVAGLDLARWLTALLTATPREAIVPADFAEAGDVHAALRGSARLGRREISLDALAEKLRRRFLGDRLIYEAVDALHGTDIGSEIDQLVIKSCLDFFDEGQSVWGMPERKRGLFAAWGEIAGRNPRLFVRGLHVNRILSQADSPEGVIVHVMRELGVPEEHWVGYFTRELARLHGWAGFIRWRAAAGHYHWSRRYPADLVDYLAMRLTLALSLLTERGGGRLEHSAAAIAEQVNEHTRETYLRQALCGGSLLPAMALQVEQALARGGEARIARTFDEYATRKRAHEATGQAERLKELARLADAGDALAELGPDDVGALLETLAAFERAEGMIRLRAMEAGAMKELLGGLSLAPPPPREKRPFVQALFCIDTRSERLRRHLEGVGDYQTFGIAGFFGVPVSFMELGKGSEVHLCPVLITPKNLVLELTAASATDEPALGALKKAVHELEGSVLTPFVTVEAIGLLFGLDMVGKTVAPRGYHFWRKGLHRRKPTTRLLLSKLNREQADSIVRAVQRAVIVKAVELDLHVEAERITDAMVRELREAALGHEAGSPALKSELGLDDARGQQFIERLRREYRINRPFAQLQMEQLGRIGFTLDEQAMYVGRALRSIGLTEGFSRFVLLVGHGSTSENNPYESALDCGACGGNSGLVSARVLAQMANSPEVRRRLTEDGIRIPADAWFVPALHDTTTDAVTLLDLDLLPPSHLVYLDRLRGGLNAASRLCANERIATLRPTADLADPAAACSCAERNSMDWSQVRPEWGLSRNAWFVIGRRSLTQALHLDGRAFLHSYDWRLDPRRRLLENILTGPLVVGQWINMEHYFSTVDNERYGSGSKVYHNVVGRFGVMTGNLSDLRTGLPSQTVLDRGEPYHQPMRLIALIEAPLEHANRAVENVIAVKRLVRNGWIRLLVLDPETSRAHLFEGGNWQDVPWGSGSA